LHIKKAPALAQVLFSYWFWCRIGSIDRKIALINLVIARASNKSRERSLFLRYSGQDDFTFKVRNVRRNLKNLLFSTFMGGAQRVRASS